MSRRYITLKTNIDGENRTYKGRFLGFIKDDEFNALVQNAKEVGVKLESKATQPLIDVASKFDNLTGYRLVMTVRSVSDKTGTMHNVADKTLFITEGLNFISSVSPGTETEGRKVVLQGSDTEDIIVQEVDNE
jgi:hypothetical protein